MDWSLPATMIRSGASAAPPEGAPHEQDDDRPDHSDHDALDVDPGDVTLVEHRLGEVPAHDCPDDAKDDRPDQPLASADEEVRQKPCDGTEHDPTDDAHRVPPVPACRPRCGSCETPSDAYGRMWSRRGQEAEAVNCRLAAKSGCPSAEHQASRRTFGFGPRHRSGARPLAYSRAEGRAETGGRFRVATNIAALSQRTGRARCH